MGSGAAAVPTAVKGDGSSAKKKNVYVTPTLLPPAESDPDVIGLSILSGSHLDLVPDVLGHLRAMGVDAPVVVGGIIPEDDRPRLAALGIAAVYTPKDFELAKIMRDIADIAVAHRG